MARAILEFSGVYRFLSNFSPAWVKYGGEWYPTVEHAYQAAKTSDKDRREEIRKCSTPAKAKRAGKTIPIRPGWDGMRVDIMRDLLRQKFAQSKYRTLLLSTGDAALVEGNWWGDVFWGVCKGKGENMLGRMLMELRDEISLATVKR